MDQGPWKQMLPQRPSKPSQEIRRRTRSTRLAVDFEAVNLGNIGKGQSSLVPRPCSYGCSILLSYISATFDYGLLKAEAAVPLTISLLSL